MHEMPSTPEPKQHPTLSRFYDWVKQRTAQVPVSLANKIRQSDKTHHQENRYATPHSH